MLVLLISAVPPSTPSYSTQLRLYKVSKPWSWPNLDLSGGSTEAVLDMLRVEIALAKTGHVYKHSCTFVLKEKLSL